MGQIAARVHMEVEICNGTDTVILEAVFQGLWTYCLVNCCCSPAHPTLQSRKCREQLREIVNLEFTIGVMRKYQLDLAWLKEPELLVGLLHSLPVCEGVHQRRTGCPMKVSTRVLYPDYGQQLNCCAPVPEGRGREIPIRLTPMHNSEQA